MFHRVFFSILLSVFISICAASFVQAGPPSSPGQSTIALEERTGELEIIIYDDFKNNKSETKYYLRKSASHDRIELRFKGKTPVGLRTGNQVKVKGNKIEKTQEKIKEKYIEIDEINDQSSGLEILSEPVIAAIDGEGSPTGGTATDTGSVLGTGKAVVLMVDLQDFKSSDNFTLQQIEGVLYSNPKNMNETYQTSSYDQFSFEPDTDGDLSPDVFGPFQIDAYGIDPDTGAYLCRTENSAWSDAVNIKATQAGINLLSYQYHIYVIPSSLPGCIGAGWATRGCTGQPICRSTVREVSNRAIDHEIGHNLGFHHAGIDLDNNDEIEVEYGDLSSTMGNNGSHHNLINIPHRDQAGWLDTLPVGVLQTINFANKQIVDIYALELDPNVVTPETQIVKLFTDPLDHQEDLYISYRKEIGEYGVYQPYADEVHIHRLQSDGKSALIARLNPTEEFIDANRRVKVSFQSASLDYATVQVSNVNPPALDVVTTSESGGQTYHNLSWLVEQPADHYEIYSASTTTETYSLVTTSVDASISLPVDPGSFYCYKVTSVADGFTSEMSRWSCSNGNTQMVFATPSYLPAVAYWDIPYSYSLLPHVSGGTPPYTYTVSFGGFPRFGINFNNSTGELFGTPIHPGPPAGPGQQGNWTIAVTDVLGESVEAPIVLTYRPALPARINGYVPGARLTNNEITVTWNDVDVPSYRLTFGSSVGAADYFDGTFIGTGGSATNLPTNGETLFVRLYSGASEFSYIDYIYTAYDIPILTSIDVIPVGIDLVKYDPYQLANNETQQFTAHGYDQYGELMVADNVIWTVITGSIEPTGYYTAPSYAVPDTVTATSGGVEGTFEFLSLPIAYLTMYTTLDGVRYQVTWSQVTLAAGQNQQFSANAHSAGQPLLVTTINWTASDGAIIDQDGNYMVPTTPGEYTVTAESGGVIVSTTVIVIVAPDAPTNLTAEYLKTGKGSSAVHTHELNWDTSSGADSYDVYRSTSSTGPWDSVIATVTSNAYSAPATGKDDLKYYALKATNAAGPSGFSVWVGTDGTSGAITAPTPQAPISNPGGPYSGYVGTALSFDGSGSTDADGSIVSYDWDFGDTTSGAGVNPSHTYTSETLYTVTLTVTDNDALTNTASTSANISIFVNNPPVADPGGPYTGTIGVAISMDGSSSSDDVGIVSYAWDFGDGQTGSGATSSNTYAAAGTYTVSLTVTDGEGLNDTTTTTADVQGVPSGPDAPTNLTSSITTKKGVSSVVLIWDANAIEPDHYSVLRSQTAGSGYTWIADVAGRNQDYKDSDVVSGLTYYYVVRAVDNLGVESMDSNETSQLLP